MRPTITVSLLSLAVLAHGCGGDAAPGQPDAAVPLDAGLPLDAAPPPGPMTITGAYIEGPPTVVPSVGDLWMTTWAEDGTLYTTWGDGLGPAPSAVGTDSGLALLDGALPGVAATVQAVNVPTNSSLPGAAPGLVLHYTMRPKFTTNPAEDHSGNGNDGRLENGADCTVAGLRTPACRFDGIDDYIGSPTVDPVVYGDALTVSVLVRRTTDGAAVYVSAYEAGAGFLLGQTGDGAYRAVVGGAGATCELTSVEGFAADDGQWTHLMLKYAGGSSLKLFRNFQPIGAVPCAAGGLVFSGDTYLVGRASLSAADPSFFAGDLDEVRVFAATVLPEDVRAQDDDKPSSLLALGGRLYLAGHTPLGDPDYGYMAYSDDRGATWTEVWGAPWTNETESPFRVLLFMNRGQGRAAERDGHVYALGMGREFGPWSGEVYLARAPQAGVADYSAWEYLTGAGGDGQPSFSADPSAARPLPGLFMDQQGSAAYHEGAGQYLLLTQHALFAAPDPWGPWVKVADLFGEMPPGWPSGAGWYSPGIITKDAGPDSFYFTVAGAGELDDGRDYRLHVGRIRLVME